MLMSGELQEAGHRLTGVVLTVSSMGPIGGGGIAGGWLEGRM